MILSQRHAVLSLKTLLIKSLFGYNSLEGWLCRLSFLFKNSNTADLGSKNAVPLPFKDMRMIELSLAAVMLFELTSHCCKDIAQVFNQYFTNIAAKIDEDILRTRKSPFDYLGKMNELTFFLSPSDSAEVESIISDLKKANLLAPVASHVIY